MPSGNEHVNIKCIKTKHGDYALLNFLENYSASIWYLGWLCQTQSITLKLHWAAKTSFNVTCYPYKEFDQSINLIGKMVTLAKWKLHSSMFRNNMSFAWGGKSPRSSPTRFWVQVMGGLKKKRKFQEPPVYHDGVSHTRQKRNCMMHQSFNIYN